MLRVLTLDPVFEQSLVEALRPTDSGTQVVTDPNRLEAMIERLRLAVSEAEATGRSVVLVCAPALRPALRKVVLLGLDRLPVLSYAEVTGAGTRIETVGVVSGAHAIAA